MSDTSTAHKVSTLVWHDSHIAELVAHKTLGHRAHQNAWSQSLRTDVLYLPKAQMGKMFLHQEEMLDSGEKEVHMRSRLFLLLSLSLCQLHYAGRRDTTHL